jgi:hypothetical protein
MSLVGWIAGTSSAAFAFAYVLSTMVTLSQGDTLYTNAQTLGVIAGNLSSTRYRSQPLTARLNAA